MVRSEPGGEDVVVVGLGRFGGALATTLVGMGYQVLGLDRRASVVQEYAAKLTHVLEVDSTDIEAMRQVGAHDFTRAVVAIGDGVEASILSTAVLVDLEVPDIWAKAITESHGRILQRVGAHHVVFPEHEMGERVAHLLSGRVLDYMELDESFALVESRPPKALVGRTLGEAGVRAAYGVTVVCVKPEGESFTYATTDTVVQADDILLVAGDKDKAEAFALAE